MPSLSFSVRQRERRRDFSPKESLRTAGGSSVAGFCCRAVSVPQLPPVWGHCGIFRYSGVDDAVFRNFV